MPDNAKPKIVAFIGSPRKGGNSELLAKELLKSAEQDGAEIEAIRLAEYSLKPCDACMVCRKTKKCKIDDDGEKLFNKISEADGVVLATPVYFGSCSPQMKIFVDRMGYMAKALGQPLNNKVGSALVVARRAGANFTYAQLLFFFLLSGMIVPGVSYWTIAYGREKGEVLNDKEGIETAREMGKKISWLAALIKKEGHENK
ncbi:MAG: flavodoxin family protein [Promethearchaeati archaeon SRVP18_Atabeyarchaeia-1]